MSPSTRPAPDPYRLVLDARESLRRAAEEIAAIGAIPATPLEVSALIEELGRALVDRDAHYRERFRKEYLRDLKPEERSAACRIDEQTCMQRIRYAEEAIALYARAVAAKAKGLP